MEVNNYSITNDATSMDLSNLYTGVGQLRMDIDQSEDSPYLLSRPITLTDFAGEDHIGVVQQVQGRDEQISVVAEDVLRRFNVDKYVDTTYFFDIESSTLEGVLQTYCDTVDVEMEFRYTPSEHFTKFLYLPGGKVNIWNEIKELAAVHKFDLWVEGEKVIVDNIGTREIDEFEALGEGWSVDNSDVANWIEVTWFRNVVEDQGFTWQEDMEYYPRGNNEEAQILQVDANETVEVELEVNAWVAVWNQPTCVDWVDNRVYDNTNGVYSVVGNDNLPVTAAQWTARGGSLTVEPTDDPSVVKIILKGANVPELAPFRIAMSSGNHYNSLHLTGWAYLWEKVTTRVYTGAGSELTSQEVGAQIESRNIQTLGQAYDVASRVAAAYAGPNLKIDLETLDAIEPGTLVTTPNATFRVEQVTKNPLNAQATTSEASTIQEFNEVWDKWGGAEWDYAWEGTRGGSRSLVRRNGVPTAYNEFTDPWPRLPWHDYFTFNSPYTDSGVVTETNFGATNLAVMNTMHGNLPDNSGLRAEFRSPTFQLESGTEYLVTWTERLFSMRFGGSTVPIFEDWLFGLRAVNDINHPIGDPIILREYHGRMGNLVTSTNTYMTSVRIPPLPVGGVGWALYTSTQAGRPGNIGAEVVMVYRLGSFAVAKAGTISGYFDGDNAPITPDAATFEDFNYEFPGVTFQDYATTPLRRIHGQS